MLLACLSPDAGRSAGDGGGDGAAIGDLLAAASDSAFPPAAGSLRQAFRKVPVWSMIVAGVLPHVVVSVFNLAFNGGAFVSQLPEPQRHVFWGQQVLAINAAAYAAGIDVGLLVGLAGAASNAWLKPPASRPIQRSSRRLGVEACGSATTFLGWDMLFGSFLALCFRCG